MTTETQTAETIAIVFDGPPANESGRFIEVEDSSGASIAAGDWHDRGDGTWELRIEQPRPPQTPRTIETVEELNALWIEAVVRSSGQTIWEKGDYEEDSKGLTWWISPGDSRAYPVHQITLPATVLFDPETDK